VPRPDRVTLVRDRLTWLTYLQLAAWCYFLYAFQPIVPLLRDEQGTSRAVASLHGSAFALGGIIGGLILPALTRSVGRQRLIWLGLAGVCAATGGLWIASSLPFTLALATLASLSGAFTVNAIVSALTDHHGPAGPAAISEANAAAAGVGLLAPLVVGLSVNLGFGWRPGLTVVVVLIAILALVCWWYRVRAPEAVPVARPTGERARLPRVYRLAWFSLFATGSVEACLNLWVADVLRTHAGVAPGTATAALSASVGGMFIGRLIGGQLVLRYPPTRVLLAALGLSAAGFAVFWTATVPWLAFAGLVLCGLGVSLHYPLGIGLALANSDGQPDLAAARASYAIGLSFGLAPFVLGALADRVGPHTAFLLLPVFIALAAVAIVLLDRRGSAPPRERDAVGERKDHGIDPVVVDHQLVEIDDRAGLDVVGRRVEDATAA
jgi:predicted MFS family arabinose efflux permease